MAPSRHGGYLKPVQDTARRTVCLTSGEPYDLIAAFCMGSSVMLERAVAGRYQDTVAARRVTVVTGPRQSGKTTLVQSRLRGGTLRSLDDQGTLDAALADPVGFLALGARPLVIDEVQRRASRWCARSSLPSTATPALDSSR